MKLKNKFLVFFIFFLMSFSIFAKQKQNKENVEIPNIVLYDQNGKLHNLEEYKGKAVFINFWATWCGYCVKELPEIEKLYKEFGENKKEIVFLGVVGPKSKENPSNVDIKKEDIIKFINKKKLTFPILFDESGSYFQEYGIRFFPISFIVNKEGFLEEYFAGAVSEEQLRESLNEILKK